MIPTLAVAALAAFALTTHTDSTLTVGPGARLELENFAGEVVVQTWDRNAVRIECEHSRRTEVEIERDGSTVSVRTEGRNGVPLSADFKITVPATAALEISGVYTDVTVAGAKGDISVETVGGDVSVTGGGGHIALQSVEGEVALEGSRGHAELSSVNSGVTVRNHTGELAVETVNGAIVIERGASASVEASTVNGSVLFDGVAQNDGHYSFTTHNGDITVGLQPSPSVSVSVSTFGGSFESSFPVKASTTRHGRRSRFTLGSGSAELELESFQGSIRLTRSDDPAVSHARAMIDSGRDEMKRTREGVERGEHKEKVKDKDRDKDGDSDGDSDPDEEN
jgi:DUF4097 and DUF4098 domain-containing protein YvlB